MRITDFPELVTATGNDLLVTVDTANDLTKKIKLENLPISIATTVALATKQNLLVSGTNIKTLNSVSLLGSGDIVLTANPSGVAGAIQFSNGSAFASDATNLFWDDTNNYLGIGTNTPSVQLEVQNNARIRGGLNLNGSLSNSSTGIVDINALTYVNGVSGFVGVGISTPSARLHVKGSGSTSATTSLLVQNSAGTQAFKVDDQGIVNIGLTSAINWQFSSNTLSSSQFGFISSNNGTIISTGALSGGVHGNNNGGKVSDSGISTPQVASAVLEVSSTTKGFLPPRMTTTQKNAIASPAAGLVVYDSTTNKLCCYNGSTWNDLF